MGKNDSRRRLTWKQVWPFYIYFEAEQLREKRLRDQMRTARALEAQSARLAHAVEREGKIRAGIVTVERIRAGVVTVERLRPVGPQRTTIPMPEGSPE